LIQAVIALVCAVEPSAFSVPDEQTAAGADEELRTDGLFDGVFDAFELEHAPSSTAAATTALSAPVLVNFTEVPSSGIALSKRTL
jgi:hypothetical protein